MTTVLDLLTSSARLLGVVRKSESLAADEAQDALTSLNDMLSSWSNESLFIYSRVWESFSLSPAASYTIGASQTINTIRPVAIKTAFISSGGVDYYMDPVTDEQYEEITVKSISSPFPQYFNYDNGYPVGVLRFWPLLSTSSTLNLLSEKQLTQFTSLVTVVDLPPGTKRALRFNLALELAPEYGIEPPTLVVKTASDSLRSIWSAVAKNRPLKFKRSLPREISIYDGGY